MILYSLLLPILHFRFQNFHFNAKFEKIEIGQLKISMEEITKIFCLLNVKTFAKKTVTLFAQFVSAMMNVFCYNSVNS